ncbi:MAG: hypothetical protein P9M07_08730 [Candidatus Aceula meridiana]|nr:hypothetical protein [Candidatus Aceula meridiana]
MKHQKDKTEQNEQFEVLFLEGVLDKAPKFVEALIKLGDLYTKQGFFEKGLKADQRLVKLRPEDPTVLYNLACSYSLVGKLDKSFTVIQIAIDKGYEDFNHLKKDNDLKNLRYYLPFQEYFRKLTTPDCKKVKAEDEKL